MKRTILFFLFLPRILMAQYHFDFENGSVMPLKQVPADRWEFTPEGVISGAFSLHHSYDNPESGIDYCLFRHDPFQDSDSLSLSFRVRHVYDPSSANSWQVALLAEFSDRITGGLVLGVNFTGSDDLVNLWEISDGNAELIGTTGINYQDQIGVDMAPFFRLVWHRKGEIKLFFSPDPDDLAEILFGVFPMDSLPVGRNLVIRYKYSPARDRGLWLDELCLDGRFVPDTVSPAISGLKVIDPHRLQLSFSEKTEVPGTGSFVLTALDPEGETGISPDFVIPGPASVIPGPDWILLSFSGSIPNRNRMRLDVSGICDSDGNCLSDTALFFMREEAEWGDVVFTEIMFDPDPVVRLPNEEYLEIYNRSVYSLEMEGWSWETENRKREVGQCRLEPGKFMLLTGNPLPNNGATVALYNREGTLIHATRYGLPWRGPDWKSEGGWSLESPDPEMICNTSDLWEFSTDPRGGTPGFVNSVRKEVTDREPPQILYLGYAGSGTLRLKYSEPVRFSFPDSDKIRISPGEISPDTVIAVSPLFEEVDLCFGGDLPDLRIYELTLPGIADCAGNLSGRVRVRAGNPVIPRFGAIIINEIMYDPLEGCPEYVELLNVSDHCIDIQDLSLDVGRNDSPPSNPVPLTGHSRLLAPGDYLVVSACTGKLLDAYFLEQSGCWLEMEKMPDLVNSGGTVYLADRSGVIVDMAGFGDHMHVDLLNDSRGISLERIFAGKPGTDPDNWHSAASIEGYATPGRANSQSVPEAGPGLEKVLAIEPAVFSPDNDGYQDLQEIHIETGTGECVIRLLVTDLQGNRVRELANNHIAGPVSTYTWDGEGEDGTMVTEGFYVIHLWAYHPGSGKKWIRKVASGVIYR